MGDNLTCPTESVPALVANWWQDPGRLVLMPRPFRAEFQLALWRCCLRLIRSRVVHDHQLEHVCRSLRLSSLPRSRRKRLAADGYCPKGFVGREFMGWR